MRRFILGVILGCVLVGAVWAWVEGRRPAEAPVPPLVRKIQVPITVEKLIPGDPTVVERLEIKTVPGEVDPSTLRALALRLCGPPSTPEAPTPEAPATPLFGLVRFRADKHVGRKGDRIVAGWVGEARCLIGPSSSGPWTTLYEGEFSETASEALSKVAPEAFLPRRLRRMVETAVGVTSDPGLRAELRWYGHGKRWGFWAAGDWIPDPESYSYPVFSDYQAVSSVVSESEASVVLAVGVSRRWGRP